jgi:hypothetical protein
VSTSTHSWLDLPHGPDVLGELLHSLSQPLTGLRCSLEISLGLSLDHSLEEVAEQQQESVAAALQQTEKVIGMVQLMREYVDAEQYEATAFSTAVQPVMRNLVEELSSIAALRNVQLCLVGTCTTTMPVPEARLHLALQYLLATMMDSQPAGSRVMIQLEEGPAGAVLRMAGEAASREPDFLNLDFRDLGRRSASHQSKRGPLGEISSTTVTLQRVKLAIARRVLETAGASLEFGDENAGHSGFVLRIPSRVCTIL